MRNEVFKNALDEARIQLDAVEQKFKLLSEERAKLQAVVAGLESYLSGGSTPDIEARPTLQLEPQESRTIPAWMSARDVIAERGSAITVPQLHDALRAKSIYTGKDALRVAMIRKPDVFVQMGNGLYGLTKYGVSMELDDKEATEVAS
jgi:hypothetical protein